MRSGAESHALRAASLVSWGLLGFFVLFEGGCSREVLEVTAESTALTAPVGGLSVTEIQIKNAGKGELTLLDIVYQESPTLEAGPQFNVVPNLDDNTLEEGESVSLEVSFTPLAVGEATVAIYLRSSGGSQEIDISGRGTNNPPEVAWDGDFPTIACLGEPVLLQGTVTDVEDADTLSSISVVLESSLEGVLGTGTFDDEGLYAQEVTLSVAGVHTITLTATDTSGDEGSVEGEVTVESCEEEAQTAP